MNTHILKHMRITGQNLPNKKREKLRQIHRDGTTKNNLKIHTFIKTIQILNIFIKNYLSGSHSQSCAVIECPEAALEEGRYVCVDEIIKSDSPKCILSV